MNLVSTAFARGYRLIMHPLSEIGFSGLAMRCADNREIQMHHFVNLEVGVEGI
jgi:hypothetical protein